MYIIDQRLINDHAFLKECDPLLLKAFCILSNKLEIEVPEAFEHKDKVDMAIAIFYHCLEIRCQLPLKNYSANEILDNYKKVSKRSIDNINRFQTKYGVSTSLYDLMANQFRDLYYEVPRSQIEALIKPSE